MNTYLKGIVSLRLCLFILPVLVFVNVQGQDIGRLSHSIKKWNGDKLILPCSELVSSDYAIPFADSLYGGGTITLKKANINGLKMIVSIDFDESKDISAVTYEVNVKDREQLKKRIRSAVEKSDAETDGCRIIETDSSLFSRTVITLKPKK